MQAAKLMPELSEEMQIGLCILLAKHVPIREVDTAEAAAEAAAVVAAVEKVDHPSTDQQEETPANACVREPSVPEDNTSNANDAETIRGVTSLSSAPPATEEFKECGESVAPTVSQDYVADVVKREKHPREEGTDVQENKNENRPPLKRQKQSDVDASSKEQRRADGLKALVDMNERVRFIAMHVFVVEELNVEEFNDCTICAAQENHVVLAIPQLVVYMIYQGLYVGLNGAVLRCLENSRSNNGFCLSSTQQHSYA